MYSSTRKNIYFPVLHCNVKDTAALWTQFNKVFAEADKLFAEAGRLMQEPETPEHVITSGCHNVRFSAKTLRDRWRLAGCFLRLASKMLWSGQAALKFKRVKAPAESRVENN